MYIVNDNRWPKIVPSKDNSNIRTNVDAQNVTINPLFTLFVLVWVKWYPTHNNIVLCLCFSKSCVPDVASFSGLSAFNLSAFYYIYWIDLTVARTHDLSQSRQWRQPLLPVLLLDNLFPLGYSKKTLHTIFYDAFYFNK